MKKWGLLKIRLKAEEGFLKLEWEERIKRRQKRIEYIQAHPEQYEGWFEEALEDERELLSQIGRAHV